MAAIILFDDKKEVGLLHEGFRMYHAARTMCISEKFKHFLKIAPEGPKQVINLGAGVDTRPYWDKGLEGMSKYYYVDTPEVFDFKGKIMAKHSDLKTICDHQEIPMDFAKESTKDLANKGIDFNIPVMWVLEGLIMYLQEEHVVAMYNELSDLSPPGSYCMVNFLQGKRQQSHELCTEVLGEKGWKLEKIIWFGDEGFNFGRYPEGKPSNAKAGFCLFTK
jgi:methyltransferase (TIGR00027 family)